MFCMVIGFAVHKYVTYRRAFCLPNKIVSYYVDSYKQLLYNKRVDCFIMRELIIRTGMDFDGKDI